MLRYAAVFSSVMLAFASWGLYGPVLHVGQEHMHHSSLRPFICVGVAYFLVAVLVPMLLLKWKGEKGHWTTSGTVWSLVAGALGAVGALGIILAFKFGGKPVYVMPIVFGCAPVVNTLVTMWMTKTQEKPSVVFYGAILVVALGAAGVYYFKPTPPKTVANQVEEVTKAVEAEAEKAVEKVVSEVTGKPEPSPVMGLFAIITAIALTAGCWGSYGPMLHRGQAKMMGSRLRPFLCVGLSYFAIAVIVPVIYLLTIGEPGGEVTLPGVAWSLLAGTVGALGAMGIILAFNFGGKPIYVMPLVFGLAPVVNTGTSLLQNLSRSGSIGDLRVPFIVSLVMVAVGAVTVLVFAPRPSHGPPAVSSSKGESGRSGATAGADRPAASTSVGGEDAEVTANPKSATSSGPSDESNR